MSDPERLIHGGDDFEKSLLQSARKDGPSQDGKARLLLTMGLGVTAAGSTVSSAAAATTSSLATSILPWIAAGALLGTGMIAAVSTLTSKEPPPSPTAIARTNGPFTSSARESVSSSPLLVPSPAISSSPPIHPSTTVFQTNTTESSLPSKVASAPAPSSLPPHKEEDSLINELRLLDQARAALSSGNLATANTSLQQYVRDYPQGKLSLEAQILRIDLLLRQGNRSQAKQEAEAFVKAHPQSPHTPRLRTQFEKTTPETNP